MHQLLYSLLALTSSLITEDTYKHWSNHKEEHKLSFSPIEEISRYQTFRENLFYINEHNRKNLTFTLKLNKFAHLVK